MEAISPVEARLFGDSARDVLAGTGLFGAQSVAGAEIEPVEGGLTNRSFNVTIDSERFVLRIPGAGTEAYIDRAQEAHNARAAAHLGIAPEVVHADPRTGVALSRRIEGGRALDERAFRDPAVLESAAKLLARLHRSDADFRGEMALFPVLDRYFRLCGRRRPDLLAPLEGSRRRAEGLRPWIEGTREPDCPCHIDPAPSNFVLVAGASSRLYLLDWEFSARCDPVWDLAYLSADAALSGAQDEHLLSCYYGPVGTEYRDRFAACKGLAHLLIAAWAALRVADGDEDPGVQRLLSERGAESERLLERVGESARQRTHSLSSPTRHNRNQARGFPPSRE